MPASPASFEQTLRHKGVAASRSLEVHPDYRELVAYSEEALPPSTDEAVREHLSFCPGCTSVVLELMEPSTPEELSPGAHEAAWEALRRETFGADEGSEKAPAQPPPVQVDSPAREHAIAPPRRRGRILLAAAGIALVAVGSTWWLIFRAPAGAPEPLTKIAAGEVDEYADALGVLRDEPSAIELSLSDPPTTWGLQPRVAPAHDRYQVRIRKKGRRSIWKAEIQPDPGPPAYFYLRFTPSFFKPGEYTLEVTGWSGGASHQLGVWRMRVTE